MTPKIKYADGNTILEVVCYNREQFDHLAAVTSNYNFKVRLDKRDVKIEYPLWANYFVVTNRNKTRLELLAMALEIACEHIPMTQKELDMPMEEVVRRVENPKFKTPEERRIMAARHGAPRYHDGKMLVVKKARKGKATGRAFGPYKAVPTSNAGESIFISEALKEEAKFIDIDLSGGKHKK